MSLSNLIAALDRDRFHPTVYCPDGPSAELFRQSGADVVVGPVASFTHVWTSYYHGLRWLLLARELTRLPAATAAFGGLLRRDRFDLIHLNDSPLVGAALLAQRARIPVVWHLRSSLPKDVGDFRSRALSRLIARTAAGVIAIDDDVARSFSRVGAVDVVHNTVDLERFTPKPSGPSKQHLGLREDLVSIGLFGYLYAKKGWPEFLRAAHYLQRRGVEAQFVLIGGGVRPPDFFRTRGGRLLTRLGLASDEEAKARQMVKALDIGDSIHFLPFTHDPREAYWALDIVTFPNRGEGLGRAVIEAAACGRPVVASGSPGGAGLLLPGSTGFLVPRRSPDALATILEKLIRDEGLRQELGLQARRHAELNFDARVAAGRVMDIYDRILRR